MKINEILQESPLPDDWDNKKLDASRSFNSRINYALSKAKEIGAGSARVVFSIPYNGRKTALKVAKNAKGLAQNNAEASLLKDGYAQQLGILIPLIDYDDKSQEPVWIQTEEAGQFTSKQQLVDMLGVIGIKHLIGLADYIEGDRGQFSISTDTFIKMHQDAGYSNEKIENAIDNANNIAELKRSYDVVTGDLKRYQNWGIWQGRPVIIDLGLTNDVHSNFYK